MATQKITKKNHITWKKFQGFNTRTLDTKKTQTTRDKTRNKIWITTIILGYRNSLKIWSELDQEKCG